MTNPVIYQKWRPRQFGDVVGQSPIVQTLRNAVTQNRVAHAYLFCGPRGTGKTSTARILAKALNCRSLSQDRESDGNENLGEPDNNCPFCVAVNEGRALDLIEMDAASNRRIDDIRDMKERVFTGGPMEGRAKVYILDEAHMLTEPAFNALLKTLEDPAPWAYFILCTTEPHKIPPTISSRCQRFDFRRITSAEVASRLEIISREEEIAAEPAALHAIARATEGSLRDAENILEQIAIASDSSVTLAGVEELLGLVRDTTALELTRHIMDADLKRGLETIHRVGEAGTNLKAFHRDLVEFLRAVLLLKAGVTEAIDYAPPILQDLGDIAKSSSWERLFQAIKLFGSANSRPGESFSTLPLELALLESILPTAENPRPLSEETVSKAPLLSQAQASEPNPGITVGGQEIKPSALESPWPEPSTDSKYTNETTHPVITPVTNPENDINVTKNEFASLPEFSETPNGPARNNRQVVSDISATDADPSRSDIPMNEDKPVTNEQWETICDTLKRVRGNKFVLGSLLKDCRERHLNANNLVLLFRNQSNLDRLQEELQYPPSLRAIQEAVRTTLGQDYTLSLNVADRQDTGDRRQSHLVRTAIAMGATIIEDTEELP